MSNLKTRVKPFLTLIIFLVCPPLPCQGDIEVVEQCIKSVKKNDVDTAKKNVSKGLYVNPGIKAVINDLAWRVTEILYPSDLVKSGKIPSPPTLKEVDIVYNRSTCGKSSCYKARAFPKWRVNLKNGIEIRIGVILLPVEGIADRMVLIHELTHLLDGDIDLKNVREGIAEYVRMKLNGGHLTGPKGLPPDAPLPPDCDFNNSAENFNWERTNCTTNKEKEVQEEIQKKIRETEEWNKNYYNEMVQDGFPITWEDFLKSPSAKKYTPPRPEEINEEVKRRCKNLRSCEDLYRDYDDKEAEWGTTNENYSNNLRIYNWGCEAKGAIRGTFEENNYEIIACFLRWIEVRYKQPNFTVLFNSLARKDKNGKRKFATDDEIAKNLTGMKFSEMWEEFLKTRNRDPLSPRTWPYLPKHLLPPINY